MSLTDTFCASESVSATVANGTSVSPAVNLYGLRLFGIVMPSSWTAANLTFQLSHDGGTSWVNMYDQDGNEITGVADVSRCIVTNPTQFANAQYLRIRSGTSGTPVAQGADRVLKLLLRAV